MAVQSALLLQCASASSKWLNKVEKQAVPITLLPARGPSIYHTVVVLVALLVSLRLTAIARLFSSVVMFAAVFTMLGCWPVKTASAVILHAAVFVRFAIWSVNAPAC